MIALGPSLTAAERLAFEVEALAEQYWRALLVGRPVLLGRAEMDRVVEKFRTYGVQPGGQLGPSGRARPRSRGRRAATATARTRRRTSGPAHGHQD
jgi:hypothetical protein